MRILKITDVYFPRINGVSTSIQTFRDEFRSKGHFTQLITPGYPQDYPQEDALTRIRSRGVLLDPEDRMMHYRDIIRQLEQLKKQQFDLIHIHTPFVAHYSGIKLAKKLGIPCIVTYHTLFEEYLYHYIPLLPRRSLRFLARRFSCRQCNQVDGVVAPSSVIVDVLQEYGVNAPIEIIPTGIRTEHFKTGDGQRFRQSYQIPEHRPVLLNVSRVAFEKNIELLLHVVARVRNQIPDVLLIIAGEGPAKHALQKLSARLGIEENIRFVGYLDRRTTLLDCYRCADLFIFSSKTETQGLVLLEAMAAGTPVLSIAAMGTRDVLRGYNPIGVTDGSTEDFAANIVDLLTDKSKLQKLGEHATEHAAQWNSSVLAAKMLDFYTHVLSHYQKS